jgi:Contractile injection system tube protein
VRTFKLEKTNDFAEVNVPGLSGQPLQFLRSHPRTLSTVLHFDGRGTNTPVRESMQSVASLMKVDPDTHAPPVLAFEWERFSLKCVLENLVEEFSSLSPDGRPSRGRMHVRFRERLSLEELLRELNLQ